MLALQNRLFAAALLAAISGGCGKSSDPLAADQQSTDPRVEAQSTSYRETSPRDLLASVLARYRSAETYHDRGVVRLGYLEGRQRKSKVAPASVWLASNRVTLQAYDVCLLATPESRLSWINDPLTSNFDSQVLKQKGLAGRPRMETLLADPILAERVSSGLAGPPPQLEWLFAAKPMQRLFEGNFQFKFGTSNTVDGRLCRSIEVFAGQDLYRFWIDLPAQVIRRVDLPPILAPPALGQPFQQMSLILDLKDASFDPTSRRADVQPMPKSPKFVRRFVTLPPHDPPAILGRRPEGFQLSSHPSRQDSSPITLVTRFAGDVQSVAALRAVLQWHASMPEELRRRVEVVGLVDGDASGKVPADVTIPLFVDKNRSATQSMELEPGASVLLDSQGRVAWTQPTLATATSDQLVTLGAVIADVLDGIDVPKRIMGQWREQVSAYQQQLAKESVR